MKTWTKTKIQGLMRHKSGTYYARLYVGDKEKWISLRTDILEVAKNRFRSDQDIAAIREGQVRGVREQPAPFTVGEAVTSYLAHLDSQVALERLKQSTRDYWATVIGTVEASWSTIMEVDLASRRVDEVTQDDCRTWAKDYRNTPSKREARKGAEATRISARYYNNSLFALRSVFGEAIELGHLYRNPAEIQTKKSNRKGMGVARIPKVEIKVPSREQYKDLIVAIRGGKHRTAAAAANMVEFLASSGCRVGEARRVQWGNIDDKNDQITIKGNPRTGTKNWEIRRIPMIPSMKELLAAMRKRRPNAAPEEPLLEVRDVRGALIRGSKAVNIPTITHHDLRHFFATTAIENGIDIPTVAAWLGHKDGGALLMKIYSHLRDNHSKASAAKMII